MSTNTLARRLASRAARRGYSLLEILVVLAIIGLISGVVAVAVVGQLNKARIETTRQSALAIRNAITTYRMQHVDDCPSMEKLLADEIIDSTSKTKDAWEQPFAIQCDEQGRVTIASGGPDKKLGNEDDIRVPEPPKGVAQR